MALKSEHIYHSCFLANKKNKWISSQTFLENLRFLDELSLKNKIKQKSIPIRWAVFQFWVSVSDRASFRQIKPQALDPSWVEGWKLTHWKIRDYEIPMAGTQFPGRTAIATQLIAQAAHFLPPKAPFIFPFTW